MRKEDQLMFDLSWGKLVIIGVVALLVIGPKELPGVLRTLGQYMAKIRRMAAEFQGQFQDAMREAEMADLKKQFDDTTSAIKSAVDPSGIKADLEKIVENPLGDIPKPVEGTAEPGKATDPVALGTAPVAPPATPAPEPAVDVTVPMPELPPPPTAADFAAAAPQDAAPQPAPQPPPPAPSVASEPTPAAPAEGGKAA